MQHSSSQQLKTQLKPRCNTLHLNNGSDAALPVPWFQKLIWKKEFKNPIWKKELKNPISNPRFQKLKSKKSFDLPATAEQRSMHNQNPGSTPTIKT